MKDKIKELETTGKFLCSGPKLNEIKIRLYDKDRQCTKEYTLSKLIYTKFKRNKFEYRGMSTGLKDKNRKLIYEGDLIKSPNNSYMLEVVRMPNGVYGCKVCKISPVWEMNLYSLIKAYDVEIIGNVHTRSEE